MILAGMNDLYIDLRLSWVRNFWYSFHCIYLSGCLLHISNICMPNLKESPRVIPNTLMWSLAIITISCTDLYISSSVKENALEFIRLAFMYHAMTALVSFSWWRHQMETFSAQLAICAGELTGPPWIPHTKASDAELWCFLWSASE